MLYTLGFGRNIGTTNDQLSDKYWAAFRASVRSCVDDLMYCLTGFDVLVLFDGVGQGVYEGVAEESSCIVFTTAYPLPHLVLKAFEHNLGVCAKQFGQEAIALSTGTTKLVQANAKVETLVGTPAPVSKL